MPPPRRIGILGGSFNPIHHAHLFAAETAAATAGLERVLLVPAAQSPLKQAAPVPAADRLAMVRLAAAGNPRLEINTVELDRPPPSYTVETVAALARRYPGAELSLILGMDTLHDLLDWRDPVGLLDRCRLVVVSRPGFALEVPAEVAALLGERTARIMLLPMPHLEISSTDLRRRLAAGEPVRYLLPEAVEGYIRQHRLYGAGPVAP